MPYAAVNKVTGKIRCTYSRPKHHEPETEYLVEVDGYHYTHIINGEPVVVEEVLSEEVLLHDIRRLRDSLLNQTDLVHCNPDRWEQMTPAQKQRWRDYKQALRDFPSTCDPHNPIWPTPPR